MNAGYYEEARGLARLAAARRRRQPAADADHVRHRRRAPADRMGAAVAAGYENSTPVRIGNAAHSQLQLDVYGEVMDALHQARRGGLARERIRLGVPARAARAPGERSGASRTRASGRCAAAARHFTHSKVMAWVAFDRAIKSAEQFGLDGPVDHWRALRDAIHDEVCRHGFDRELGSFVQCLRREGARRQPAAAAGRSASCRRTIRGSRGTIAAIERDLMVDGFVLRYDTRTTDDGLPPGEGAFLACSFWLADAYVMLGRLDDARRLFERLLALRNDLGLLSEEYDPRRPPGRQFPAGLLARRAGQHRVQPHARAQAGRAARRAAGRRGDGGESELGRAHLAQPVRQDARPRQRGQEAIGPELDVVAGEHLVERLVARAAFVRAAWRGRARWRRRPPRCRTD